MSTASRHSNPASPPSVAAGPGAAQPRIIVIDRNFILQRSLAGQDMVNQAQALSKQAETQFKSEEAALTTEAGQMQQQLQTEASQLQQQLAILAPDALNQKEKEFQAKRDQKEKEFQAKQTAFQARVTQRQTDIQAAFAKSARQVEIALEPILKALMTERNANMVLDRASVILSSVDVDVTPVAVQRLDKALPHVKVELAPVPAATASAAPAAAPRPAVAPAPAAAAAPAATRR